MNGYKRIFAVLAAVLLLTALPVSAGAQESPLTLAVGLHWEGKPLPGGQVRLHRVCMMEESGALQLQEDFRDFPELTQLSEKSAAVCREWARNLENYLFARPDILPAEVTATDASGVARFPAGREPLERGLYLVQSISLEWEGHLYTTDPFFVLLPRKSAEGWDNHIVAETKPEQSGQFLSLRVIKQWRDPGLESLRPQQIQVTLYRDEQPFDTVSLSESGNWSYQWAGLDAGRNWWVAEQPVQGYESQVYKEDNTFYIINTPLRWPQDSGLPQTGQLWWPVPVLLAAGALLLALGRVRKRERADET